MGGLIHSSTRKHTLFVDWVIHVFVGWVVETIIYWVVCNEFNFLGCFGEWLRGHHFCRETDSKAVYRASALLAVDWLGISDNVVK